MCDKRLVRRSYGAALAMVCVAATLPIAAAPGINPDGPTFSGTPATPDGHQHGPNKSILVITKAQDQKTVTARRGQVIKLELKGPLVWTAQSKDASILRPLGKMDGSARFKAIKPGTATITAEGRPASRPGQATPLFIILFKVMVQVNA